MMPFSMDNYEIEDRELWFNPGVDGDMESLGRLDVTATMSDILSLINEHAAGRWEGTLPEGVETSRTVDVDTLYDACSIGAGAAMSPVGPICVLVLELQSSARPGETRKVQIAMPPDDIRQLREIFVRATGEAINRVLKARRGK